LRRQQIQILPAAADGKLVKSSRRRLSQAEIVGRGCCHLANLWPTVSVGPHGLRHLLPVWEHWQRIAKMKRFALVLGLVLAGSGWFPPAASAQDVYGPKPASCEPGFRYVQVLEYREVERPVCKVVPVMRKKWVYRSKPDYFCLPACPLLKPCSPDGCTGCGHGTNCEGPYCREKLLKKQVEWQCGTRCVVEVVKEKVPCRVWRKVPSGPPVSEPAPVLGPPQ
jgi:hypothetical protein